MPLAFEDLKTTCVVLFNFECYLLNYLPTHIDGEDIAIQVNYLANITNILALAKSTLKLISATNTVKQQFNLPDDIVGTGESYP